MHPHILMLDFAGQPVEWIHWQTAATLYARDKVRWEAGQESFVLTGGFRHDGTRSTMRINSIIATSDRSKKFARTPPLTRAAILRRDGHLCQYCGVKLTASKLELEHVVPRAQGGRSTWTNLVASCRPCNAFKNCRRPEECGLKLIATPYKPDLASYLLLVASGRILFDQQAWLEAVAEKGRKLH